MLCRCHIRTVCYDLWHISSTRITQYGRHSRCSIHEITTQGVNNTNNEFGFSYQFCGDWPHLEMKFKFRVRLTSDHNCRRYLMTVLVTESCTTTVSWTSACWIKLEARFVSVLRSGEQWRQTLSKLLMNTSRQQHGGVCVIRKQEICSETICYS